MKYARIENSNVVEICYPIPGFTIDQCYHPDIVSRLVECAEEVEEGWTYIENVFAAPVVAKPTTPEAA